MTATTGSLKRFGVSGAGSGAAPLARTAAAKAGIHAGPVPAAGSTRLGGLRS